MMNHAVVVRLALSVILLASPGIAVGQDRRMAPPEAVATEVSIPAPDGGAISADLYGSGPRAVVLAHGGRFDKGSWREQALVLAAAGLRVLAIDFRAAVQARAGTQTPCLYDPACLAIDVLAAVRWLRATGAGSIAVVGGSLGGGGAAQAAVEAAPGEIDRVVLLAHMPIAQPERIQGRKLFIISRDDPGPGGVPRLVAIREQYEKAPDPKELVVVGGSAHAQFLFSTPQGPEVLAAIRRFLLEP